MAQEKKGMEESSRVEEGQETPTLEWLQPIRSRLEEAEEWLSRMAEEDPDNRAAYRVLAAVLRVQAVIEEEALARLREGGVEPLVKRAARRIAFSRNTLLEELGGGLPEPLLDEEWLREKLLQLAEAAERAGWKPGAAAAPITAPVEKALVSVAELVSDLLRGRSDLVDAWAGAVSVERDKVMALLYWLIQPLVSAVRLSGGAALGWAREYWQQGRCPVCGAPAAVGYMRGEGRKQYMLCSLCHMEWSFPRAKCPRCGTEEPGSIVFMRPDPEAPWLRLYRCRRCGAHWRIVDEEHPDAAKKGLPPRILYDIYTAHLDYIAEKLSEEKKGEKR